MKREKFGYMKKIKELEPGDIILFRADATMTAKIISAIGSLVPQQFGHSDTTHAAICVGKEDEKPIIAHLTGHSIMGYAKEPLTAGWERDKVDDRSFVVFRPKNATIAKAIAEVAGDEKALSKVKWDISSAMHASYTFATAFLDSSRDIGGKEKKIENSSFCSKFVIQVMKVAASGKDLSIEETVYYPDIRSTVIPKSLEAFLYQKDDQYSYLVYPGKKPYLKIKAAIHEQLSELEKNSSKKGKAIFASALQEFKKIRKELHKDTSKNKLEKSICLINHMSPILAKAQGIAVSKNPVFTVAKKMSIFNKELSTKPVEKHTSTTSKLSYN